MLLHAVVCMAAALTGCGAVIFPAGRMFTAEFPFET